MDEIKDRLKIAIKEKWRTQAPSVRKFYREMQRFRDRRGKKLRGTSYPTIHKYLGGKTRPSVEFLRKAAELTGVREEWLMSGSGEPTEEETAAQAEAAELAGQVAAGVPLHQEIRSAAQRALTAEFPEFDYLPPLAQGVVWRTFQRLLSPLTLSWTEAEAEAAEERMVEPIARALGRCLRAVLDALGREFLGLPLETGWSLGDLDGLRRWQVESYVLHVCEAAAALIPQPQAAEPVFRLPQGQIANGAAEK